MNTTRRRSGIAGIVVLCLAIGMLLQPSPASAQQQPITLRYAFFAPKWTFPGKQMQEWKRELEKRTAGKVEVKTFYSSTLLGAKDMYQGVSSGISDIGLGMVTYDPRGFPVLSVMSLPLKFPDAMTASLTTWDLIQEFNPESLKNFKVLTAFTFEPSYVQTTFPVETLEDLRGIQIRTHGAFKDTAEALGFSPVGMPMPEVPEALQKGVIEGIVSARDIRDFKIAKYIKHWVDYELGVGVFVAVMNKDTWNRLPSDVQDVIDQLRREMVIWTASYHESVHIKNTLEWAREKRGLTKHTLSPQERKRWDDALQPVIERWLSKHREMGLPAEKILSRTRELRDYYGSVWAPEE